MEIMSKMIITDLNSDCLEKVFDFLKFEDLINIMDTSKYFHTAASQVYKRKYRNQNVIFDTDVYHG